MLRYEVRNLSSFHLTTQTLVLNRDRKTVILCGRYFPLYIDAYNFCMQNGYPDHYSHFFHFQEFILELLSEGWKITPVVKKLTSDWHCDALVCLDIPEHFSASKKPIESQTVIDQRILVCIENPLLLTRAYRVFDSFFGTVVSPCASQRTLGMSFIQSETSYFYRRFPAIKTVPTGGERKLCTLMASNLAGDRRLYTYSLRRSCIQVFSRILGNNFSWFGRGWNQTRGWRISGLSSRFKDLDDLSWARYQGSPKTKAVLSGHKLSLAIENTTSMPGYTSEKALDIINLGCLPIYVGTKVDNYLSRFIEVCDPDVMSIVSRVSRDSALTEDESRQRVSELRNSITNYFASKSSGTSLGFLKERLTSL